MLARAPPPREGAPFFSDSIVRGHVPSRAPDRLCRIDSGDQCLSKWCREATAPASETRPPGTPDVARRIQDECRNAKPRGAWSWQESAAGNPQRRGPAGPRRGRPGSSRTVCLDFVTRDERALIRPVGRGVGESLLRPPSAAAAPWLGRTGNSVPPPRPVAWTFWRGPPSPRSTGGGSRPGDQCPFMVPRALVRLDGALSIRVGPAGPLRWGTRGWRTPARRRASWPSRSCTLP